MSASRPAVYPLWTDGDASKVTQPDASTSLAGWVKGEPPPRQYQNWLQWIVGEWIQYLDQTVNSSNSLFETASLLRLINGAAWSWNATTGALSWSAAFNLSVPSIADSNNQAAAGSVTLTDGQVGYFSANIPFTTSCNTTNGSAVLTNITEAGSIASGQSITGTGIPGGTTATADPVEQADGTYHVTMSANATADGTAVSLTFFGASALSPAAATNSSLVPSQTTVIFARRVGALCFVGVGSSQMVLQDAESKYLNEGGYLTTVRVTAGENLTQGQAVYISNGDGGRTSGRAYKTDVSVSNGAARSWLVGFVITTATSGNPVVIATGGALPIFTSLAFGTAYYLDPSTNGGITATKPSTSGQYIVPVGIASSSTVLQATPGAGAESAVVPSASGFSVATPALPYTISASNDNNKEFQTALSAAGQINLPAATANFLFYVKDTNGTFGTYGLTIHRNGSEQIEGVSSDFVCKSNYGNYGFYCDGTNWFRLKG